MPLYREVGLGPGDFVLDGDLAPTPKRDTAPNYPQKGTQPQIIGHVYVFKRLDGP